VHVAGVSLVFFAPTLLNQQNGNSHEAEKDHRAEQTKHAHPEIVGIIAFALCGIYGSVGLNGNVLSEAEVREDKAGLVLRL